jgi:hypothetical protein
LFISAITGFSATAFGILDPRAFGLALAYNSERTYGASRSEQNPGFSAALLAVSITAPRYLFFDGKFKLVHLQWQGGHKLSTAINRITRSGNGGFS